MLEYSSIAELCRAAEQAGSTISQTALADQAEQMAVSYTHLTLPTN